MISKWSSSTRTLHCPLCGVRITPSNRTKDHFIPLAKGGPRHDDSNCWIICRRCNNRKGDRMPTESEAKAFARVKGIAADQREGGRE